MEKNIMTFLGCDNSYEEAGIVIFGAPFDATTSFRPGTRFASAVMRQESFGLETYSPKQDRDLLDIAVFDAGDLELPFGNVEKALGMIEAQCETILQDKKLPCMIGGEHLVTLGCMRSITRHYPDVHVLHFDAHADLREEYLEEPLSHACVLRRVWELTKPMHIHQFGIRSGDQSEFQFAKQHTDFHPFHLQDAKAVMASLKGKPIYLTIDLDVLDPSIFPGTGTPEAGGVSYLELEDILLALRDCNIIGFDINELSPSYDHSGVSTAVANKVLRECLIAIGGNQHE